LHYVSFSGILSDASPHCPTQSSTCWCRGFHNCGKLFLMLCWKSFGWLKP